MEQQQKYVIMKSDQWAFYGGLNEKKEPIWVTKGAIPFSDFNKAKNTIRRLGGGVIFGTINNDMETSK